MASSPQMTEAQAQKIKELQASTDKASNYSRLVMTLGYGGFFAIWSGTKQYLSPKYVVLSALFLMISALLFIAYQVVEAACVSHLYVGLVKVTNADEKAWAEAARNYDKRSRRIGRILAGVWPPTFYVSAVTGFAGVFILLWGFGRALRAMW